MGHRREVAVFALYCPRHGHQVLLDLGQIVRLVNSGDGVIVIEARCYDGENLVGITGSRSTLAPDEVGHRPTTPPRPAHTWTAPAHRSASGAHHSTIGQHP
jgi:hypothetical protein